MNKTFCISALASASLFFAACGSGSQEDKETAVGTGRSDTENKYTIHRNIKASTFWAGEGESDANGNISNVPSAWDDKWGDKYKVNGKAKEDSPNKKLQRDKDFIPNGYNGTENLYYFALPYNDMSRLVFEDEKASLSKLEAVIALDAVNYSKSGQEVRTKSFSGGRKINARNIPWYTTKDWSSEESVVKGRWIRVRSFERGGNGEWVYAQWLDAGPFHYDDFHYVFGDSKPRNEYQDIGVNPFAGIDLSPAVLLKMGVSHNEISNGGINLIVEWQFEDDKYVPGGPWKRFVSDNKCHWD